MNKRKNIFAGRSRSNNNQAAMAIRPQVIALWDSQGRPADINAVRSSTGEQGISLNVAPRRFLRPVTVRPDARDAADF
jgi:hypothetical protein